MGMMWGGWCCLCGGCDRTTQQKQQTTNEKHKKVRINKEDYVSPLPTPPTLSSLIVCIGTVQHIGDHLLTSLCTALWEYQYGEDIPTCGSGNKSMCISFIPLLLSTSHCFNKKKEKKKEKEKGMEIEIDSFKKYK